MSGDLTSNTSERNPALNTNEGICRTCLRTINLDEDPFFHIDSCIKSDITLKQKFTACLPEVALEITVNPLICGFCAASVHWAFEYREKCLKIEEAIHNYVNDFGCDIYQVDMKEILQWKNLTTLKKLEAVEIMCDSGADDWDKGIRVDDLNTDVNTKGEIEIKEEPLLNKSEVLENFENSTNNYSVKIEEVRVKEEPVFVDVGKLIEEKVKVKSEGKSGNSLVGAENPQLNTCKQCKASFSLKCDLRLHMILHSNSSETFRCDECEFISSNKVVLRRHLLVSHTKEFEIRCKPCNLVLNDVDAHELEACIKNQVQRPNTAKKARLESLKDNWKLHKCKLCDYHCNSKGTLNIHTKKHENVVQYSCNICNECFKESVDLMRHLNVHSKKKSLRALEVGHK